MRKFGDRLRQRGNVLWQAIAREQLDLRATLVREQADAIELSLKDPIRAGEALLGERGGHRLDPFGEFWHAQNIEGRRQKAEGRIPVSSSEFRVSS